MNINKINGISIKNGRSYLWEGAGVGALLGLGVALIVSSTDSKPKTYSTEPYGNFLSGFNSGMESAGKAIFGFLGFITGALVGGIIGGNISGYETYEMDKYKFDKKREMERLLRINRKNK